MILYIENPTESEKKLSKLISNVNSHNIQGLCEKIICISKYMQQITGKQFKNSVYNSIKYGIFNDKFNKIYELPIQWQQEHCWEKLKKI